MTKGMARVCPACGGWHFWYCDNTTEGKEGWRCVKCHPKPVKRTAK